MNQKLISIARDAGYGERWNTTEELEMFLERYGKLVVKECVEICKKQEYEYWRSSEEDQWTPIDSANAIKEHFGVGE